MSDVAKVKNIEDEAHTVPALGGRLVLPGQVVEVPVEDVYGYTQQADRWEPHDAAAKKVHKQAARRPRGCRGREAADLEAASVRPSPRRPRRGAGRSRNVRRWTRTHHPPGGLTHGDRFRNRQCLRHRRRVQLRRPAGLADVALARPKDKQPDLKLVKNTQQGGG
jgi:hypothetical protein